MLQTINIKSRARGRPSVARQKKISRCLTISAGILYDHLRDKEIDRTEKIPIALALVKQQMNTDSKVQEIDHTAQVFLDVLDKVGQISSPCNDAIDITPDTEAEADTDGQTVTPTDTDHDDPPINT